MVTIAIKLDQPRPLARVTARWQDDGESLLSECLPVRLWRSSTAELVTPGQEVEIPVGEAVVTATFPPHVCEEYRVIVTGDGNMVIPDRTERLVHLAHDATSGEPHEGWLRKSVALRGEAWAPSVHSESGAPTVEVAREGRMLTLSSRTAGWAPLALRLAGRSLPASTLAVPIIGQDERIRVDLASTRPWGSRPGLSTDEPSSELLSSYLLAGDYEAAAAMAARLAWLRGNADLMSWVEPSFSQLLIGYALQRGGSDRAFIAWDRRARGDLNLGPDGLLLAAEAAERRHSRSESLGFMKEAAASPGPATVFGVTLGLQLVFDFSDTDGRASLAGIREGRDELTELAARYLRLSAECDPGSATLAKPELRAPVSLDNASWMRRLRWSLRYFITRWDYTLRLRSSDIAILLPVGQPRRSARAVNHRKEVEMPEPAATKRPSEIESNAQHLLPASLRLPLIAVLVLWFGLIGAMVALPLLSSRDYWLPILIPFFVVHTVFSLLLGAGLTWATAVGRLRDAEERAGRAEQRAAARDSDAMRGRALAVSLQAADVAAQADEPQDSASYPARVSKALFGELL